MISPPQGSLALAWQGETLWLLPEKAVFWPREDTLFIADTHWGKSAVFRAHHIPLPEGSLREDLQRVNRVLALTGAKKLCILGDLLHGREGQTPVIVDQIEVWMQSHSDLQCFLVPGNHDRNAHRIPLFKRFHVLPEGTEWGAFVLSHYPDFTVGISSAKGMLAGHLHPTAAIRLGKRFRQTLPLFLLRQRCLVLPAFGSLTGGQKVSLEPGDRCFWVTPESVISLED